MARFVWSIDPLAVSRLGEGHAKSPLSSAQLLELKILARKVPRVRAELARLNALQELDPAVLPDLALQIARQLC